MSLKVMEILKITFVFFKYMANGKRFFPFKIYVSKLKAYKGFSFEFSSLKQWKTVSTEIFSVEGVAFRQLSVKARLEKEVFFNLSSSYILIGYSNYNSIRADF